ncbi:hypothetical protein Baya_5298 [Bagarius yarrelli]|uniref:UBX domain-containing protein n=1 Tax=Bagarius yarrelli TaxID=175774 RepID=A0A556TWD4_BAGYA|nr:hypothetical protein Baya_5298 [Bagarius yarrelli]
MQRVETKIIPNHVYTPRIVRAGSPRHTLVPRSGPVSNAISAFNRPNDVPGGHTEEKAAALVLHQPASAKPEPVKSRIKQNNDFLAQERQKAAEHARAERKQNTQERELILKRIAEDRRAQLEKHTVAPPVSEQETPSKRVQSSTDNSCTLMTVVDHVTSLRPSLPSFTLFHGFPRRRFSSDDLSLSLHSLGLTPNAALVLQAITSPDPSVPAAVQDPAPPHSEPIAQQGANELPQPVAPPQFQPLHWDVMVQAGRGQRLMPGEDGGEDADEEQELVDINAVPRLPSLNELRDQEQHYWPNQGNRLGNPDASVSPAEGRILPGEAALQRIQRNEQQQQQHSRTDSLAPLKKPCTVPKLVTMATHAAISLTSAPCMQFVSSFSCLTAELAERLLSQMTSDRLLTPRTLQLFIGCSLGTLTLNSYPYTTNTLLQQLGTFTHLTHLSLVNSPLITALRSLCVLILDHTKVTDSGLLVLLHSSPPALVHLSLNQTAITEETLTALRVCAQQLRLLSITHTKVCDVSALVDLPDLQTLHLDFTQVKEETLQCLSAHRNLSSLSLHGVPVSSGDHTLEILSGLNLTQFTLPGRHSVSDAGLFFLSKHTLLSELDLSDYTHITDQGIAQLGKLTRNTPLTDVGLSSLSTLTLLVDVCLDRTAVTSRGVTQFITRLPYVQVLGLSCTHVGDSVLRAIVRCTELIKLNLSRTRITDRGLRFLHGMKLSQINLDGTGVTEGGVANLIAASPRLISIRADNTRPVPTEQQSDDEDGGTEDRLRH